MVAWNLGGKENEDLVNGYRAPVSQEKKVPETGCTTWIYLMLLYYIIKMVRMINFVLSVFCHNWK